MYWKMTVTSVGVLTLLAVVCVADTDVEAHMTHGRQQYGEMNFEDGHKAPLVMIIANTGIGGGTYDGAQDGSDRSEHIASLGRFGGGRYKPSDQIRKTPMRLKRPVFSSKGPTSLKSRKRPKCHRRPRKRLYGSIYSEYPRPGRPYGPNYIAYRWPGQFYGPIYSGYPRPGRPYGPIYSEYPRPGSPDEGQWPNNSPYPSPDRPQIRPGTNYGNYSWQGRPDGGNGGNDGANGSNMEITERHSGTQDSVQEREEQTEAPYRPVGSYDASYLQMDRPDSTSGETTTELVTRKKRRWITDKVPNTYSG